MSRGLNKVTLIGNLGADPEVRYTQSGDPIANFSLATGESWKDRQTGEAKERTEWHRVVIFGKLAEVAKDYLRKGAQVYLEGQLRSRKWQGQDGQDHYTTEVVVSVGGTLLMLGGKPPGDGQRTSNGPPTSARPATAPSAPPADNPPPFDDDIPF